MKVNLLYFSSIKDRLGKSREEVELPDGSKISDLYKLLEEKYPQIAESLPSVMFAVNEEYADRNTQLKEGDTVALIPPVSGG
ncbi:molybdopterin converting factor subunit 1 [Persephonella sp.]|nr:molybdopterin converting factor subunit 1 [Aquificota bacterium]